jgi:hypothetical protein
MRWFLLILICLPLSAQSADDSFSAWLYDYFIDGASVKLGTGTRQSGISVQRSSDGAEGKIYQVRENSFFYSYSTSPIYFSFKRTGLTFSFNATSFNADQQQVGNDKFVGLGSRVNGSSYYFVPTVFYEFGYYRTGRFARIGAGLGAGFARFNGDVVLTSTNNNESVTLKRDSTDITFATSLIVEAFWEHFGLTLQYAAPRYETSDYAISVEDISLSLGYNLVF